MTKSVAVTFCKENLLNRKPGELSGVGLGMWASQYADVQVTRHLLVDLLSDQESSRARALKQLGREGVEVGYPEVALVEGVEVGYPEVALVKNALPALVPHQPHVLDRITDEVFAMTFDSEEGSRGYVKARIGDKAASGPSIPWRKTPLLDEVPQKFREAWGHKFSVPVADCYIYQGPEGGMDFHGDDERNVVICLNIGKEGETRELDFQGFEEGFPVGKRLSITLEHGDIYLLSEKAVGIDWRCETKYLKSITANIDIGYNKLTSKETFEVIQNSHQMGLVGVLEKMENEEVNEGRDGVHEAALCLQHSQFSRGDSSSENS